MVIDPVVASLIGAVACIPSDEFDIYSKLEDDLALDSLDRLAIFTDVEGYFGIKISDPESILTVMDLQNRIRGPPIMA